jgi:septum site-determining protein MinC
LANPTPPDSFRLRAGNFSLLVLRLLDPRPEAVLPALGDQFRRAPGFLRFAPVVIGLADLPADAVVDFRALVEGLRALEIVPIGTIGGTQAQRQAALSARLPPMRSATNARESEAEDAALGEAGPAAMAAPQPAPAQAAPEPPAPPAGLRAAMVVSDPVRSGQRVYAQGCDLIVTATVNAGAEVIADGNIHVYGALRGRAVAGAGAEGDASARIFALNFDPELVAIAGLYAVREQLGPGAPVGRAVQVRLDGEQMRFEPLA